MTAIGESAPDGLAVRVRAGIRAWAMAWGPRLFVLAFAALALWLGPGLLKLPVPEGAVALTEAQLTFEGEPARTVSLPHRWPRADATRPARAVYALDLPAFDADEPMVLLLPSVRLRLDATLDGSPLPRDTPQITGTGAGSTVLLRVPEGHGEGRLELTLRRTVGMVPGYLSPVYLVPERAVADDRWRWVMGDGVLRMAALGVHMLMVFAVVVVWTARRRDPVFCWLVLLGVGSLVNVLWGSLISPTWLAWSQNYINLISSSLGLILIGLSMAIIGMARPRWLKIGVVVVPLALALGKASGLGPPAFWNALGFLIAIAGNLAGCALLLGLGRRPTQWDRLLLAAPLLLTACFGLRDVGVLFGLLSGPFLMTSYVRTLTIVAVLALLMRRLAASLNELDAANETQRFRLREQETELNRLHDEARTRAALDAREEERRRLMRDLHDGVSGHLVSIIALSERERVDRKAIETAARGALEDLRLVVNSLDLEDGDLRLALAGFRERLAPQLRRLGVAFEWSMGDLPEISGVTPAGALSILRILQEAVTNALKHGPARRIVVTGAAGLDGAAILTVANDGEDAGGTTPPAQGRGMDNMRRRAWKLGGEAVLHRDDGQTILTLTLPARLTEP